MWEKVTDDTERLRVPGGWLYRTWYEVVTDFTLGTMRRCHTGLVYVPDPGMLREMLLRAAGAIRT
jgi:hypothetical protein